MNTTVPPHDIHRLLHAEHDDPFGVLGLHQIDQVWVVRSLRPDAKELAIVDRHNVERRFRKEQGVDAEIAERAHENRMAVGRRFGGEFGPEEA